MNTCKICGGSTNNLMVCNECLTKQQGENNNGETTL